MPIGLRYPMCVRSAPKFTQCALPTHHVIIHLSFGREKAGAKSHGRQQKKEPAKAKQNRLCHQGLQLLTDLQPGLFDTLKVGIDIALFGQQCQQTTLGIFLV